MPPKSRFSTRGRGESIQDDIPRDHCGIVGVALQEAASADKSYHDSQQGQVSGQNLLGRASKIKATGKQKQTPPEELQASVKVHSVLQSLQHRGQDSVGIATWEYGPDSKIQLRIEPGLVKDMGPLMVRALTGTIGIGHVRYSTSGSIGIKDAQPTIVSIGNGHTGAFAFNGNVDEISGKTVAQKRQELGTEHEYRGCGDGEVLADFFASFLRKGMDFRQACEEVARQVDGAYSFVFMTSRGELLAFKDPHGIRPLSMGRVSGGSIMFASESVAFDVTGIPYWREVKPGEMVFVEHASVEQETIVQIVAPDLRGCWFEHEYFAKPNSVIEGKSVYATRFRSGQELARANMTDAIRAERKKWIIVPVPDTARSAAEGISDETGLPVREGIIKNRWVPKRSFILPEEERAKVLEVKFDINEAAVRGKNVIVVEDSIVRGSTMKNLVRRLKEEGGAGLVEVWVASPPIVAPCYYGIDIASRRELAAAGMTFEEANRVIGRRIGADRLRYQSIEGLTSAMESDEICKGCLRGVYPTQGAQRLYDRALTRNTDGRDTEVEEEVPLRVVNGSTG